MKPDQHPPIVLGRIGVLLVNLGTPEAPTAPAVRRYLGEFLSDRRVVELPPLLWKPILHGIILRIRPRRTAALYAKIWDQAGGGSPLMVITRDQAGALRGEWGEGVEVTWAMRYGQPSIAAELTRLRDSGCDRILLAPLYPQYSAATSASVFDAAARALATMRWQPALRVLPPYYRDPAYIDAIAGSLTDSLAVSPADAVLMSFHGMPRRTLEAGDPYHCQCQVTARLVRERLGLPESGLRIAFQSRFGRQEWLRPYAVEEVAALARSGVRRLTVICPGFSADCLETLEEVRLGLDEVFRHAGGEALTYVPCLNAAPAGIVVLRQLIDRELAGWIDPAIDRTTSGT